MLCPHTFWGKKREEKWGVRGSRQHWYWNDVNFGAMRNLHTQQEQIDDSSKQKSAVWPAGNWKLVRGRDPMCIPRGSRGWQIEFFKMAATRSFFHMLIFQCDIDTPSIKMWDLGYIGMLALGTSSPCPSHIESPHIRRCSGWQPQLTSQPTASSDGQTLVSSSSHCNYMTDSECRTAQLNVVNLQNHERW